MALSPNPIFPPGAPLPWLGRIQPTPDSYVPTISEVTALEFILLRGCLGCLNFTEGGLADESLLKQGPRYIELPLEALSRIAFRREENSRSCTLLFDSMFVSFRALQLYNNYVTII